MTGAVSNESSEGHQGEQGNSQPAAGDSQTLLDRRHFHEHFDTNAYLKDFYSRVDDPAMQLVLFHLPNLVARIGSLDSLLDFGSGPTIHVAVCFRNTAKEIFLADYLPQNRAELAKWMCGRSDFDWTNTLKIIAAREALPQSELGRMETEARQKVRAILHCNCLASPCLQMPESLGSNSIQNFDAITTFFTLEYCCLSREEYAQAVQRVCSCLAHNGLLIMGGILEETWCAFGGRKFKCLYIDRAFVLDCLRSAGLSLERDQLGTLLYFERDGMFLLVARKDQEDKEN